MIYTVKNKGAILKVFDRIRKYNRVLSTILVEIFCIKEFLNIMEL